LESCLLGLLFFKLLVVSDVVAYLVPLLLLLAFLHGLKLSIAHCELVHDHFVMLHLLLLIDLFQGLSMLHLLFNVVLVVFDFSLRANLFICHLSVKLELQQSLSLDCPLLSELLLLVMKKCVEFDDGVPLVVLCLPGLTHLGKNFQSVTSSSGRRGARGDGNDAARFSLTKAGRLRRAGRGSGD